MAEPALPYQAPESGRTLSPHRLTEYGTTTCPIQRVRAEVDDDGDCSACGAVVLASCARCGGEYPVPVEYHHTEQECESAWEADAMTTPVSARRVPQNDPEVQR